MKILRLFPILALMLACFSCGKNDKPAQGRKAAQEALSASVPVDNGFSRYISGYTSGVIPSNASIEIQFTPDFAAMADKSAKGLFSFSPSISGNTEWRDDVTLVFTPSRPFESGKTYSGILLLNKLAKVDERLNEFPFHIQALRKDFRVNLGAPESLPDAKGYTIKGSITTTDIIKPSDAEKFIEVKLGKKTPEIEWEHKESVHIFTIKGIARTDEDQSLIVSWDGKEAGIKQKGSSAISIPRSGVFSVLDVFTTNGATQRIDVILSDPADPEQELTGIVHLSSGIEADITTSSNIISLLPASPLEGQVNVLIESSLRSTEGNPLGSSFSRRIDFSVSGPSIALEGDGVILPSSKDLIFPFRAVNLKAVDLRIIKIFENNLPYFLQENDITGGYSMKRFGKPIYSGKIDIANTPGINLSKWNLFTVDLSDYIDVEPGVLYKVSLSMRKSYSLYPCSEPEENNGYDELLKEAEDKMQTTWYDPNVYYDDPLEEIYYSFDFDWEDRNNPCKDAYYSPDKRKSRNLLASNLGLIAKMGDDNNLHVIVTDLLTALPVNEVSVDVFDYQLQKIASGTTDQEGDAAISCDRQPFLLVASKDKDRNYLKINEGASLSLSSFDVSGTEPENGIKAFIYGERDVWRPGDSIFLSVFIKDMKSTLPADHPVQFELINPLEQKVDNQVRKIDGKNLLVFKTVTTSEAVTGNYRAVIKVGGAAFSKRVRVETIKPNRLKIDLDFGKDVLGGSGSYSAGSLRIKWLNGSTARNLNASVEYILRNSVTRFEKYNQYIFDDPVKDLNSETVSIFDGKTDENGNATVVFNPSGDINAPGMLNAIFTVKAMEPGGDESIISKSFRYAPYKIFAGINFPALKGKERMLFTDADNEVKIVTVDSEGKPVNSEVEISVYKLSYRWWWESDRENLGYYVSNENYKPVIERTVNTKNGQASFKFNINRNDWGRYLIRATVPSGHSTGKILLVDWPWEYGMKGKTDGATLVSVGTDKEKYNPGDEVRLSFPSPENSRAIITLENSTGVVEELRTATGKGSTEVKFRVRPEMAPNVYAFVTIIQPHAQTINDMPVRLYGIAPVLVEDPDTRLTPIISMNDELRSMKPFVVKVNEKSGKPMTYTLAIVDEGLLDITGFKTPDPWNYFYSREALGVHTWDLYDNVLGAFGGALERVLAIGGDEALQEKAANKTQRFIPVVKFLGPFTLEAGKTNSHGITLPQYTGSVRTMVIAGTDKAFGIAEKTVPVKDPLMVLVTAPRVISPGESVNLPVTLFVQKDNIKEVTLSVNSENVTFNETNKSVSIQSTGETDTDLHFTAGEKTGMAKIAVTATGGGENASYQMEIDIRNPNPQETRSELKILNKGEKWESGFTPFGTDGTNSAVLEISSLPSINLEKKLSFLINYPHGCSEQTTSAAFPQLYLKNVRNNDADMLQRISSNVHQAINVIASRQMVNGSIAMWPGSYQPDNWITSYAGHFMIEAGKNGYSLPSGFMKKWLNYQSDIAREWREDPRYRYTSNDQAYRLFTLALAGEPERGAMNRLRESKNLPQLSRWLLSAAFVLSGRPEAAQDLLDMRNTSTEPEYRYYNYGSELRDRSIILYTLSILKNEEQAFPVLKEVCEMFNNINWYSTQDASWALLSYIKFIEIMPQGQGNESELAISLNGEKSDIKIRQDKVTRSDLKIKKGVNSLQVENRSERPVYVSLTQKGVPLAGDATAAQKGLSMSINYYDLSMKPVEHQSLKQGTDFMMVVKVSNNVFAPVDNLALAQMIPSGWEIRNTRLFEADYGIKEGDYEYRDFRDDAVKTYFSLASGQSKTFVAIINAAYTGEFNQPSVWCEAMYTPNVYARIPGGKVRVIKSDLE